MKKKTVLIFKKKQNLLGTIFVVEGSFAENVQNRQYSNFVQCIFISRGSDLSYAAEICETGFK